MTGRQYLYPHERRTLIIVLLFGSLLFIAKKYLQSVYTPEIVLTSKLNDIGARVQDFKITDADTIKALKQKKLRKHKMTGEKPFAKSHFEKEERDLKALQPKIPFDPNRITANDMIKMGLAQNIVSTIEKYRNAGGIFYKNDDLKKIYGLDSSIYHQLEPYLKIEQKQKIAFLEKQTNSVLIQIDLNTADETELMQINGIGPAFSKRIIKYRQLLGFYKNPEQLKEIYGLNEELFDKIKDFVFCSPADAQLKINFLEAYSLSKHPYIDYKMAKIIAAYRKQHGPFHSAEDLEKIILINDTLLNRISPYLDFKLK